MSTPAAAGKLIFLAGNIARPLRRMHGVNRSRRLCALLLAGTVSALTASCAAPAAPEARIALCAEQASSARAATATNPTPRPAEITGTDLTAAVHAVAPSTTVAAAVFDRRSAVRLLAVNADRRFRAASVVKLLIAIDTLRRSPTSSASVARMLTYSSNAIASALWVRGGGPAIIRRTAERIGLADTAPPGIPGRWGNTSLSARDVVAIYRYILTELPHETRETIVGALAATTRRAADGWNQYFGIPSGIDRPWAVKQGWGSTARVRVLHSTGLVGEGLRYIVVLLTEHRRPQRWETLRPAVTAAAETTAPLIT